MNPIPTDHYTIVCHPSVAEAIRQEVGPAVHIIDSPYVAPSSAHTIRWHELHDSFANLYNAKPDIDRQFNLDSDERINWHVMPKPGQYFARIETEPRFVKESDKQENARAWVHLYVGYGWRKARSSLQVLLDPNYQHPKRKRP